jgi:bifunctional UDP-N-acetylglucosamine pyrophosphorylase/glucosamine-1-phosphate N-acetyltransferase
LKTHKKGENTISAIEVKDVSQYGAFRLEGNLIKQIVEKPTKETAPSNYANVGMYVFTPEIFEFIQKTSMSPRGEYEITDTMQLMIEEEKELIKHDVSAEEWLDIGLPWMLLEANMKAMRQIITKIDGTIEEGVILRGPIWIKKGATIRSGSYIEGPVIVGEDSDVGPNSYLRAGTCLGKRVRIGNACEVKNSIIMDDTHAAHLSYIGDSIIGNNCNIGAGTVIANLRFDKKNIKVTIKGERLDSERRKLGAIIGNNVETGINVSIHPGIIVGNDSWIAPGVTVQRDVPNKVIVSLRTRVTSWPR